MAQHISPAEMRHVHADHHAVPVYQLAWERYAEINHWLADATRPGFFSIHIERDAERRVYRMYLLSHPDTAMEFKMRWM